MLQGVQLIINRAGIYNNYMHGQGIIIEDSRFNCLGCCYMKHYDFKNPQQKRCGLCAEKILWEQGTIISNLALPQTVLTCFFICST